MAPVPRAGAGATAISGETQVSKFHPEQWMIREDAERPEKPLVTALQEFATTQIADCGGPVAIVARGASLPAATGIDDLISGLARDRAADPH